MLLRNTTTYVASNLVGVSTAYENYLTNLNELSIDLQKINENLYVQDTLIISIVLTLLICTIRSLNLFMKVNNNFSSFLSSLK